MKAPRTGSILLLALAATGFWAGTSRADFVTDPVGFFTVTFRGDSQIAFNPGLVNPVEIAGEVAGVSGNTLNIAHTGEDPGAELFPDGGHFSVYDGGIPGLNLDATAVTRISPQLVEFAFTRTVDGLISVGDVVALRRHTTLADFFGANNEAGIAGGTSPELADNIAIWDNERQTSRIFYWHSSDGFVEAGNEGEGDRASVPIRFPNGAMFTRRASTDVSFTRAGHVLVPSEQQLFPVKQGMNVIACSLWTSDVTSFEFSDYRLFEPGSPYSVQAGASASEADVIIHSGMETGLVSDPIYYQSDAGGGHWQFVGGGDAGSHPVNGFATIQFFRSGADGFVKFTGTSIAQSPKSKSGDASPELVDFELAIAASDRFELSWKSRASSTYQIQTRQARSGQWASLGPPITGSGGELSKTITLAGSGEVRIIEP
ncbi:MAG: hypothetical protein ACR2RV_20930 [Verrucomicrobiales bacterium]